MKMLSLVLILISSLSSTAYTSIDLCHNLHANLQTEELACHTHKDQESTIQGDLDNSDLVLNINESDESNETGDNHKHCETHCSHHSPSLISENITVVQFDLVQEFNSYKFTILQTYLEGPFRPPLA